MSSPKKWEGTLAPSEEMQDDRGREQSDLSSCEDEPRQASADAAGARPTMMGGAGPASAEPRRRIKVKRLARPAERRGERQNGGGDDPDREVPPTRRRRVARPVVQLRALVAIASKPAMISAGDVTSCTTAVVSVMSASQSCKNSACKTT